MGWLEFWDLIQIVSWAWLADTSSQIQSNGSPSTATSVSWHRSDWITAFVCGTFRIWRSSLEQTTPSVKTTTLAKGRNLHSATKPERSWRRNKPYPTSSQTSSNPETSSFQPSPPRDFTQSVSQTDQLPSWFQCSWLKIWWYVMAACFHCLHGRLNVFGITQQTAFMSCHKCLICKASDNGLNENRIIYVRAVGRSFIRLSVTVIPAISLYLNTVRSRLTTQQTRGVKF